MCGRCGKEHADQHQCTAAAHRINCKGDHPAFSKQCPKFLEEQAILRYRAEHGGTFQQARAAVIVETPRSVSSRTYAQALRPGQKPKGTAQPKASDKVSTPVTPKANAQRHTPPSSPRGAVSHPADTPRACKPSKEGAPREKINRFGTMSDMDVDSVSGYLSDERKSRPKNTRSLGAPPSPFPIPTPALPPIPVPTPFPFPDPPDPTPYPTHPT